MTNNIEKLYELANIDKKLDCQRCGAKELKAGKCFEVDCESTYPPFSNTKQLELIKWLAIQRNGFLILNPTDDKKEFLVGTNYYWGRCDTQTKKLQDFPQALAGLVCELWEDLSDKQREEIKRIL